jgi:hypothetical protein
MINGPANVLMMERMRMLHEEFGSFHFALEATEIGSADEYHVNVLPEFLGGYSFLLPSSRKTTLASHNAASLTPPDPRLLAVHAAIANILHDTGRGELVDRITQDYKENIMIARDGRTDLARLFSVSLLPLVETRT